MTFNDAPPTSSSPSGRLTGDSLPIIDLRLLSHSDLLSLSLSTAHNKDNRPIAADGDNDEDEDLLVNPKIDRSVFNESAGSRRQTFSRLRLAPRQAAAAAASAPRPPPQQLPIEEEDPRVISLLRQLFQGEGCHSELLEEKTEESSILVGVPIEYAAGIGTGSASVAVDVIEGNKKRGRPKKTAGNDGYDNQGSALVGTQAANFKSPQVSKLG